MLVCVQTMPLQDPDHAACNKVLMGWKQCTGGDEVGPELQNGKETASNTSSFTLLSFIIITEFKLRGIIKNWEFKISNECLAYIHRK